MPMCGGNFRGNRDDCTVKRFTGVNWDGRGARASPPRGAVMMIWYMYYE